MSEAPSDGAPPAIGTGAHRELPSGVAEGELEDLDETLPALEDLTRLDPRRLLHPFVIRSGIGLLGALAVLLWPGRTDALLTIVVAGGMVVLAALSLWTEMRHERRWPRILPSTAGLAIGGFLLASGDRSASYLAQLVGALCVGIALRDLVAALRHRKNGQAAFELAKAEAILTVGLLLLVFPEEMFAIATTIFALGWVVVAIIAIAVALDRSTGSLDSYRDTTELIEGWINERSLSVGDRSAIYDKLLYEGPDQRGRLIRFVLLIAFSSAIGSMGIITDSTAVVIGAMLIAPLMVPLMAMAISLTMGWPVRLLRSSLVVLAGIVLAVAVGVLLGVIAPTTINTATNAQIISRSAPTLLDLIIASAAGAAGAYGLSRPDVSDALPGVAVAIALLPPLATVGIAYSQGDWTAGNGAMLLFLTNAIAIVIVGGLTFVLTGITPVQRVYDTQRRIRTWTAALTTTLALVIGGLLLNGTQIARNTLEQTTAETTASDWLDNYPEHDLVEVTVRGDVVLTVITGPAGDRPETAVFAQQLSDAFDREVTADVRLIVQERETATGTAE